jgi:hypothetical protein
MSLGLPGDPDLTGHAARETAVAISGPRDEMTLRLHAAGGILRRPGVGFATSRGCQEPVQGTAFRSASRAPCFRRAAATSSLPGPTA